ncbi:MAG: CDP-glycerol glycerophosphotransferase family protein [Prevotella sp.]|nr:CDP-glycerol glycerophosphotransferase family protein [Prevotella sp.]
MSNWGRKLTILHQRIAEKWLYRWGYRCCLKQQQRYMAKLRAQQRPVRVVFVALNVAMWKYQGLVDLLKADPRFKVVVVLSPGITYKPEQRLRDLQQMRQFFSMHEVDFVDWRIEDGAQPVDIRRELKPDVVFYMQPYHGSYHPRHCFLHFTDRLIAYSPYSYLQVQVPYNYDNVMQNVAWRCYYANDYHVADARRLARNKGVNALAVGYTSADEYLSGETENKGGAESGAATPAAVKTLIWAPHCTLANDGSAFSRSNFLMMADYMVGLARRHSNDLHIVFKPHPGLLTELYMHTEWGKERADEYYGLWRSMENTSLADGTFIDLFRESDAMVHDSGSFVVDYLYFNHPVMYVSQNIERAKGYVNEPGRCAYDAHYIGRTTADVEHFVDQVVLSGHDTMEPVRKAFYNRFLKPPGGHTTAQNIYADMVNTLCLR